MDSTSKDKFSTLILETAEWWAGHWNAHHSSSRIAAKMEGGADRLDELAMAYGLEILDYSALGKWRRLEKRAAALIAELRFGIFTDQKAAIQAAVNVAANVLYELNFRPTRNSDWGTFQAELAALLGKPQTSFKHVRKCIRRHLDRPANVYLGGRSETP